MEFFQSVLVDVGVDLGGGDVGMAKHELHGSQVCAMGQEVGGKGMTQHVRGDGFVDPSRPCRLFDDLPETETAHGAAPVADKKGIAAAPLEDQRSCRLEVLLDNFPGRGAKGDQSFLVALADHPDKAGGEIAGGKGNGYQLGNPHPGGVEEVQHGVVPLDLRRERGRRGQESDHFAQGEGLGELAANPRKINGGKGVVRGYAVGL